MKNLSQKLSRCCTFKTTIPISQLSLGGYSVRSLGLQEAVWFSYFRLCLLRIAELIKSTCCLGFSLNAMYLMLISKSQSLKISRSDIILLFNFVNSSPSFACQLFFAYCYNFASICILYHINFACIYKIKGGRQLFLLQKLDSTIECSISNVLSENVTSAQRATTILTLKSNTSKNVNQ
jgi:hypothetical protein